MIRIGMSPPPGNCHDVKQFAARAVPVHDQKSGRFMPSAGLAPVPLRALIG
jgi:hypothetical protein